MEKFKTLNNQLCKLIIRNAVNGSHRAVYIALYNNYDCISEELMVRLFKIINEVCPLTSELLLSLPNRVQAFYNHKWLLNEIKF